MIKKLLFATVRARCARSLSLQQKRPVLFSAIIARRYWKTRIFVGGRTWTRPLDPLIKSQPRVENNQ